MPSPPWPTRVDRPLIVAIATSVLKMRYHCFLRTNSETGRAMRRLRVPAAAGLLLAVVGFAAMAARAQDFPTRPVRIIIGFGPGAIADITARLLGARMGQSLGQQFVVESR